ncbi:MAG TPA: hypothetical protein VER11_32845 [Polyangiaceae bacterium]|nr:hypothetical protein [Polyangiaceae bacterium]
MSFFKRNSLAVALVASAAFGLVAIQGCSSDEQNTPAAAGAGGSHAGSGGKSSTAGGAGKPVSEGGSAGEEQPGAGGEGGGESLAGAGGEGGGGPDIPCDLSFDNSTLTVYTDNGGKLPPLP